MKDLEIEKVSYLNSETTKDLHCSTEILMDFHLQIQMGSVSYLEIATVNYLAKKRDFLSLKVTNWVIQKDSHSSLVKGIVIQTDSLTDFQKEK